MKLDQYAVALLEAQLEVDELTPKAPAIAPDPYSSREAHEARWRVDNAKREEFLRGEEPCDDCRTPTPRLNLWLAAGLAGHASGAVCGACFIQMVGVSPKDFGATRAHPDHPRDGRGPFGYFCYRK